ncbi:MAG: sigma-70 family RNA polymerase sigma factor [Dehalococcoidia bacterium]|nr:sigma-70 family RNA polymerase sigma factor [Dehalococcoidia bacterium]
MRRSVPAQTDDEALIGLAASGDREAFGDLYERYAVKVFRHAYFLTGEVALAEDLTAQTFLNAMQAICRYESRGVPFVAWLLRIAGNLVINYRKSHKNNGHAPLPDTLEATGSFYSPEASCEVAVDGERVWQEVRKLSQEQRRVIVMRFVDDLSYPDIAQVLGKSVGAVRVIQFRALSNLRHLLDGELNYAFRRAS